jgi:hypothetical protein
MLTLGPPTSTRSPCSSHILLSQNDENTTRAGLTVALSLGPASFEIRLVHSIVSLPRLSTPGNLYQLI